MFLVDPSLTFLLLYIPPPQEEAPEERKLTPCSASKSRRLEAWRDELGVAEEDEDVSTAGTCPVQNRVALASTLKAKGGHVRMPLAPLNLN